MTPAPVQEAVLSHLRDGPLTIVEMMAFTGASYDGVCKAMKKLCETHPIARDRTQLPGRPYRYYLSREEDRKWSYDDLTRIYQTEILNLIRVSGKVRLWGRLRNMMILDLMDENPGVAPHLERLRASDVSIYPLLSTRKRITKCLKLMPTAYQEPIGRRYRSNPIITIDWVKVDEVLA